jgi:hypothetical protein
MNRLLPRKLLRRARLIAPLFVFLFACFAGCNSMSPPPPPAQPDPEPAYVKPPWLDQPDSWERLVSIEEWLQNEGAKHRPDMRVEALLQLNNGRVKYSQKDLEMGTAPPETIRQRIETARDGFNEVLADPEAGPGAKTRAKIGLQSAVALLDAPVAPHAGLVIVKRAQWKAKSGRTERLTALKGAWSRITVHHSDEDRSRQTGGTLEESEEVVRAIQKFHMEDPDHGWGDIGYHFLIDSAGRIFEGRELQWQGAHAGGSGGINNLQNIGICMLGDFKKRSPTAAALNSLQLLIDSLRDQYKIPTSRVYPHKHFVTTECPGPSLTAWLKSHYS